MEFNKEISNFLSSAPLYKKFSTDIEIDNPWVFQDYGITCFCNVEKSKQTHILSIYPKAAKDYFGSLPGGQIPFECLLENDCVSYSQHYVGVCQSCKTHKINLLLDVNSDKPFPDHGVKYTLQKTGQFPAHAIIPSKELGNYLIAEDLENYKKSLMCLSQGYGIGAYAYLRRIVENEIHRLLNDISELNSENSDKLKKLLKEHKERHDMSGLIDQTFKLLPASLKSLGDNPFKLLYQELSVGIHELKDQECLDRANVIEAILKFLIKRINEEKDEVEIIKSSIEKLKGG